MPRKSRDALPNVVLYNLRDARGETQQDVADAVVALAKARGLSVGTDSNQVSRWERGTIRPQGIYRQLLAEHFGVSIAELGLTRQRLPIVGEPDPDDNDAAFTLDDLNGAEDGDPYVTQHQEAWRQVRRALNRRRVPLARAAASLYPDDQRLCSSGLIAHPAWLADAPVPIDAVTLTHVGETEAPAVTGAEDAGAPTRPLEDREHRYTRYSIAVRDLERPRLFENRIAWRLLDVEWAGGVGHMTFGDMTYFDAVDLCEAVAHETANALTSGPRADVAPPSWRGLSLRRLVGDPFDGSRRPILPSTNTLTLRRDRDGASFVLHNRDAGNVAIAGGMLHIMPAGVFQPSSVRAAARRADFDLWRNIMREYSEEFLGNAEHGGAGGIVDYARDEPFGAIENGRAAGTIRPFCFGAALDALTLWGELLTVTVFDAPVYDKLFADLVRRNEEGSVVRTGKVHPTSAIPFTDHVVRELLDGDRLAPAAAGCLQLAWDHRRQLLDD